MKTNQKNHQGTLIVLTTCGCLLPITINAQQNVVLNGGFETGTSGWTGNLTWWGGFCNPAEGGSYAEVRTFGYQDLVTTPGQTYHLRFAMAGNFNWPGLISMQIYWGDALAATTSWNPAGHSICNLDWIYPEFDLKATDAITRLQFVNPGGINQSALLDAVTVVAVPEPSSMTLVGIALLPFIYCCFALKKQKREHDPAASYEGSSGKS